MGKAMNKSKHWNIEDISWQQFRPDLVDPGLLKLIKTASVVEENAPAYAEHLARLFPHDQVMQDQFRVWAKEEVQHGETLGRWAEIADPSFNFRESFEAFQQGYQIPNNEDQSLRGSLTGEMIARCVVETGTSTYYTALGQSAQEPVLKEICRRIAADEFRHYKLFYKTMKECKKQENSNLVKRLWAAIDRISEVDDEEMTFAYHATNIKDRPYDIEQCGKEYIGLAYQYYRPEHLERMVAMILKAVGISSQGRLHRFAHKLAWSLMQRRLAKYSNEQRTLKAS
jgi:rubrerythrin